MGPVRLFTPYKRRRRNNEGEEKKPKKRANSLGDSDLDNIHQTSDTSHNSKEAWQTLAEGLDGNTDYHLLDNPETTTDPSTGKKNYNLVYLKLLKIFN